MYVGRPRPLLIGAVGLALAGLLAPSVPAPLPLDVRWLAAFLLFVVLPGWLLVEILLPSRDGGLLESVLLALAAGYGLAIMLGLVLHALFRPIAPWQIATGAGLLVVVLAVLARRGGRRAAPSSRKAPPPNPLSIAMGRGSRHSLSRWERAGVRVRLPTAYCLLPTALLILAAGLRLTDLGWSEFQGDEARVVLRAMAALQGAPGALAAHRKVPGEIMLAYLFAGGLGQITELIGRLPFALAGVAGVMAFYVLARALFGHTAALVAALLLAVNGYFVAFGRILQYDSLAFFLGTVGLICCWRFGRGDGPPTSWAILGALTLASALLVALGAIFLAVPALLLAWPGFVRHARSWRVLLAWGWPVIPGLLAVLLVLGVGGVGDGTDTIWSYLGPRLGGERPYWNDTAFLRSANHYLSTPYLLVVLIATGLVVLLAIAASLRAVKSRGLLLRLVLAVGVAAVSWDRPRLALALGLVLLVVFVLRAAGQCLGIRVALAWAAGPLLVHLLLVRVPGTHWREAFPGLLLLMAALLMPLLADRRSRWVVGGLLAALIVGSAHYCWVTLVQRWPEYQLAFPRDRHPLDWTDDDGRGIGGVFGLTHHHGWKALGALAAEGALPGFTPDTPPGVVAGGYATNESLAIAAWYLRQPQGCAGTLAYVFRVPRAPQDRNLLGPVPLPNGYVTGGHVQVDGHPTITIQVPPGTAGRQHEIQAEPLERHFDAELSSAWRPVGELYRADVGIAAGRQMCGGTP